MKVYGKLLTALGFVQKACKHLPAGAPEWGKLHSFAFFQVSHSLNPDGIWIFSVCIWGQRASILAFRFYHTFSDLRKNKISKLHHNNSVISHSLFSLYLITLQFKSEAAEPNEMDQWKRTLQPQDARGVPHQSVLEGRLVALLGLSRWSLFWFPDFFYLFPLSQTPHTFWETSISHFVHFLLRKRKSSLIFSAVLIPS